MLRSLFVSILSLLSIISFAQTDTVYFNKTWKKTTKDSASYYRTAEPQPDGKYKVTDHYLNGKIQMSGYYSCKDCDDDSCENGYFIYCDSLGFKEMEGNCEKGKRNGMWKAYFKKDSSLAREVDFKNGIIDGHITVYDSLTHHKVLEEEVSGGMPNGALTRYYDDRRSLSKSVMNFKNGFPDGTHTIYFYTSAGLLIKTVTSASSQSSTGHAIYYDSATNIKILEGNYNDGKREGKWQGYFAGNIIPRTLVISCTLNYKNDGFDGVETWYYKSGKIRRKSTYKDDKLITGKCFDEKGKEIPYTED